MTLSYLPSFLKKIVVLVPASAHVRVCVSGWVNVHVSVPVCVARARERER